MVDIKAVWNVCDKYDQCSAGQDALCSNALSSGAYKNDTFHELRYWTRQVHYANPRRIDPLIAILSRAFAYVTINPCGGVTA